MLAFCSALLIPAHDACCQLHCAQVAAECKKLGAKEVDTVALDLTKPECVEELAKRALSHGPVFVSHHHTTTQCAWAQ